LGDDGIIISVPTAKQLFAKMGDSVTVEVKTKTGQKNTGRFIIKGIIADASIFGYYKAYVSRSSLKRLLVYGGGDCSSIGFFFDNPAAVEEKRAALRNILAEKIQTGPLVYDRDEMEKETDGSWEGTKTFLFTLPVYMSEISDLLDAMNILTYFLYVMMLLIILVSAVVTYRLILHERTKEMGVMRAIGFYGADLRLVLWTEIATLGFISLIAGFFLAWILTRALSFVSFDWFPGFDIFMKNGKLAALFLPRAIFVNVASIFILLFAAVIFPAFRASRKNLPGLLSGEPL
jgi:putative ABC transport system permease protein